MISFLGLGVFITQCDLYESGYRLDDPLGGDYVCLVEVNPKASERQRFATYHKENETYVQCNATVATNWFNSYPERLSEFQQRYQILETYHQTKDHRNTTDASVVATTYPLPKQVESVGLTVAQIQANQPAQDSFTLLYPPPYNKFFINQSTETMYLTSSNVGLAAIDIHDRYRFVELGRGIELPMDDLFIINSQYAYSENGMGSLYLMDVSDPQNIQQLNQWDHLLNQASAGFERDGGIVQVSNTEAPQFGDYILYKQGFLSFYDCNEVRPTYPDLPEDLECDADGTCVGLRRFDRSLPDTKCSYSPVPEDFKEGGIEKGGFSLGLMSEEAFDGQSNRDYSGLGGHGGAGALTQMMQIDDVLYVMEPPSNYTIGYLTVLDIQDPTNPQILQVIELDNAPEALTYSPPVLAVSGRTGLIFISVADPKNPEIISSFQPDSQCQYVFPTFVSWYFSDPLVIQGDIAYRTVGWEICNQGANIPPEMQIIDLSNLAEPLLLDRLPMNDPQGITILGNYLYIADGCDGVKVIDISNPEDPTLVRTLNTNECVKDLILNHFDLYTLGDYGVQAFYVAPFYEEEPTVPIEEVPIYDIVSIGQ